MNDKFARMLATLGWERKLDSDSPAHYGQDYVKNYRITLGDEVLDAPILARFRLIDTDGIPNQAYLSFVLPTTISPGASNRVTKIVGRSRILAGLDLFGYMTALKFVLLGNPVKYFDKLGKIELEKYNALRE